MNSITLLDEFRSDHRAALQPEGSGALAAHGLQAKTGALVGYSRVRATRGLYDPAEDGSPAIIIPAFSYEVGSNDIHGIYDLIAVGLTSRRTATRCGIVQCLGERWLDLAWVQAKPVRIFLDGLEWLAARGEGLFLVDLASVRFVLGDIAGIWCSSDDEAKVLHDAMERPSRVPPIFVEAEAHRAAA